MTTTADLKIGDRVQMGDLPAYVEELGLKSGAIATVHDVRDAKTLDVKYNGDVYAELPIDQVARLVTEKS
jgi:preprotein translocase subunit YajC